MTGSTDEKVARAAKQIESNLFYVSEYREIFFKLLREFSQIKFSRWEFSIFFIPKASSPPLPTLPIQAVRPIFFLEKISFQSLSEGSRRDHTRLPQAPRGLPEIAAETVCEEEVAEDWSRGKGPPRQSRWVCRHIFSLFLDKNRHCTVLSCGVRSLFAPTRKSSPWGNYPDGGLNQSIKRRLSLSILRLTDWLIDWRKVNFDLTGLLDLYCPICFYGGGGGWSDRTLRDNTV